MGNKAGILDKLLAPLGQHIVDPNGAVSSMISPEEAERVRLERLKLQELAKQKSIMESAAVQPSVQPSVSSWNPFTILFGNPADQDSKGLLGK